MLDAAFVNWIESISERGFDDAYLSLLRANGYYDVHFTHGAYEFGKDVIAKRVVDGVVEQHAFQSKAGDITGAVWAEIFSQLNELLGSMYTHPSFDRTARQVRHLVTTGRLAGKAILSANEFKSVATSRGVEFVVDDSDALLELLRGLAPTATIASPSAALDVVLGKIVGGSSAEVELEASLGTLIPPSSATDAVAWRALLDITICARTLASQGKPLHASWTLLHGIRLAAVISHVNPSLAKSLVDASMRTYVEFGAQLLVPFMRELESPSAWVDAVGNSIGFIVAYPSAAIRVAEYLALSSLFREHLGEREAAREVAASLSVVVQKQPGCSHPVSDRSASSIAAVVVALVRFGHKDIATSWIVSITKWVCDRYEDSPAGLASSYASPTEEVRTLLMPHFEGVHLHPRRESLIAVALADLSRVFAVSRYPDVLNDLLAVGIVPSFLHPKDHPDAYFVGRNGQTQPVVNARYPESADSPVPHFSLQGVPRTPERLGGVVLPLVLACIARDRLFSDVYQRAGVT